MVKEVLKLSFMVRSNSGRRVFVYCSDSAAAVLRPTCFCDFLSLPRFRHYIRFPSSSSSSFPLPRVYKRSCLCIWAFGHYCHCSVLIIHPLYLVLSTLCLLLEILGGYRSASLSWRLQGLVPRRGRFCAPES